MPINILDITPYASFIVAFSNTANPNYGRLQRNLKAFVPVASGAFSITNLNAPPYPGISSTYALHVKEKRSVAWSGSSSIKDQLNHLVAYFALDSFALIHVSDSEIKAEVVDALYTGEITGWRPADERVLVNAYITDKTLKTLWLGSTHRNVSVRPNSKVISGLDLADAIDPFGDSTFVAGAVRSDKAGVSLKRSGLWFRPSKSWVDLGDIAKAVLDVLVATQARIATLSYQVHWGLATNVFDLSGVGPAYDVEWAEADTLKGSQRRRKLEDLKSRFDIEIGGAAVANKDVSINVTDKLGGTTCAFVLQPTFTSDRLVLAVTGAVPAQFSDFVNRIEADPEFIRVYYDSWHTIANASLSLAAVQDRPFDLEFLDFAPGTNYDVDKEKPPGLPVPIADIFTDADVSLFKWVFKDGLRQMGLSQPAPGACWLYCDDGSGEIADFIHIELVNATTGIPKITLIHVKGANSKKTSRRISAGAYEIVTAQAMKNLRRMISKSMIPDLTVSIVKHHVGRVWDQPWSVGLVSSAATGVAMLAALATITANCDYEVIVVQPHVLQSKYLVEGTPNLNTASMQLRSLLFGGQLLAQAAGAKFRVVSDNR